MRHIDHHQHITDHLGCTLYCLLVNRTPQNREKTHIALGLIHPPLKTKSVSSPEVYLYLFGVMCVFLVLRCLVPYLWAKGVFQVIIWPY